MSRLAEVALRIERWATRHADRPGQPEWAVKVEHRAGRVAQWLEERFGAHVA